jgi:protein-tyrosine phosphatase
VGSLIDIHSHILPSVDDGAQTVEEAINMARLAVKEGITKIIATPHHQNGEYFNRKQDILERVIELNHVFQDENIPLEVLPGQETRIYGELLEDFEKGDILTLNTTNYLFVELPSGHVPRYTEKLLFDVQLKGLTPVIVHPERNREIIERPEMLYQFVKNGALTQVTAGCLCGDFGKKIKAFTLQLVEFNLTHFIASDAHNTTKRRFRLQEAYKVVSSTFNSDFLYMFKENAELLVAEGNVYKEMPERIKRKKLFKLF